MMNQVRMTLRGAFTLVTQGAVAALLILPFTSTNSQAITTFHNDDFIFTGAPTDTANDFHVEFASSTSITVDGQCCRHLIGSATTFGAASVSGSGTNFVTMNWSGFSVLNGQGIHAGYILSSSDQIKVVRTYWTKNGVQIGPSPATPSVNITGGGANYVVARVTSYTTLAGSTVWGHQYVQRLGTGISVTPAQTVSYARSAFTSVGPVPVPDTDLDGDNAALNATLDGVQGPIIAYQTSVGTPAMGEWGMILLVAAFLLSGLWMIRRRQNMQST